MNIHVIVTQVLLNIQSYNTEFKSTISVDKADTFPSYMYFLTLLINLYTFAEDITYLFWP